MLITHDKLGVAQESNTVPFYSAIRTFFRKVSSLVNALSGVILSYTASGGSIAAKIVAQIHNCCKSLLMLPIVNDVELPVVKGVDPVYSVTPSNCPTSLLVTVQGLLV